LDANDYRSAMRRVGIAAIIVGAVDIVEFIVAVVHRKSYSSGLSIFAVIAGVALIRGNLNTCLKVVRWIGFTGGTAIGFTGGSLLAILLAPGTPNKVVKALTSGAGHLDTEQLLISLVPTLLLAAVMVWGFRTLTSPAVLDAMRSGGVDCDSFLSKPTTSFYSGLAFGIALVSFMFYMIATGPK
jgi:hypothetical protein